VDLLTRTIKKVPGVGGTSIDLASGKADLEMDSVVPHEELARVVRAAGPRYELVLNDPNTFFATLQKKLKTYLPLILIFAVIVAWTLLHESLSGFNLHNAMHDFMGGFFIIFGLIKVSNWRGFAESYVAYDPIAARVKIYAFAYPLIELFLGVGYQFRLVAELPLNIVTVIILGAATYGIIGKLKKKELVQCACLGGFFNIPISWVTVFENGLMIAMAIYMQIALGRI
jgi:copper chaperone CopZ